MISTLSDEHLLVRFIGVDVTLKLYQTYPSLKVMAQKTSAEIEYQTGLSKSEAQNVVDLFEFSRRVQADREEESAAIVGPEQAAELFFPILRDLQKEKFVIACLDSAKHVLDIEVVSMGSKTATVVDIGELLKLAVIHNATSVIVAHNHPSGNPKPSQADLKLTDQIKSALKYVNIVLDDHIIVCGGTYTSMRNKRLI